MQKRLTAFQSSICQLYVHMSIYTFHVLSVTPTFRDNQHIVEGYNVLIACRQECQLLLIFSILDRWIEYADALEPFIVLFMTYLPVLEFCVQFLFL